MTNRITTVVVALSFLSLILAGCAPATGGPVSTASPRASATVSLPPQVKAVIPTDHGPAGFPLDASAVYVANHRGATVQRIDPSTNRIIATGKVGGELNMINGGPPTWACTNVDSKVHHLDAATLATVSSAQASCDGGDLEVIDGVVWATPGPDGPHEAVLFDARTGSLLSRIPLPGYAWGPAIPLGPGRVVLAGGGPVKSLYTVRGNPAGSVRSSATWVVLAAGEVYDVPTSGVISRLDPRTLKPMVTVQAPPHYDDWNNALTSDGKGHVWYRPDYTHVYAVDLSTRQVRLLLTLPWEEAPTGILYAFGSLWISNFDADTVWRVDPWM